MQSDSFWKKHEHVWVKLVKDKIWESTNAKMVGVKIDKELKFDEHTFNICLKANRKFSSLTKLSRLFPLEKRRKLFKAFIELQFRCCPLLCMFHARYHKSNLVCEVNRTVFFFL